MGSQLDLDQGGSFREFVRSYLGPSVGWVLAPIRNVVPITTTGTTTLLIGTTLVPVNVAAIVTVQLPLAKAPTSIPPNSLPGPSIGFPITVVDVGGHAATSAITILPAGAETIMGLASIAINANYGGFTLIPDLVNGGWTLGAL